MTFDFGSMLRNTPTDPETVLDSVAGRELPEIVTVMDRLAGRPDADETPAVRSALQELVDGRAGSDVASQLLADLAPLARNVAQMRIAMRSVCALAVLLPSSDERRRAVADRDAADTKRRRMLLSAIEQGLPLDADSMDATDRIETRFVLGLHRVRVSIEYRDATRTTRAFDGVVALIDGEPGAMAAF